MENHSRFDTSCILFQLTQAIVQEFKHLFRTGTEQQAKKISTSRTTIKKLLKIFNIFDQSENFQEQIKRLGEQFFIESSPNSCQTYDEKIPSSQSSLNPENWRTENQQKPNYYSQILELQLSGKKKAKFYSERIKNIEMQLQEAKAWSEKARKIKKELEIKLIQSSLQQSQCSYEMEDRQSFMKDFNEGVDEVDAEELKKPKFKKQTSNRQFEVIKEKQKQ